MAITEAFTQTVTASTTELSLTNGTSTKAVQTAAGVYQLWLDLSALLKGDAFTIRCYEKVQAAGTQRVVEEWFVAHAQTDPHWVSPSLILMQGWDFTIIKTAGTDRSISASVRKVA